MKDASLSHTRGECKYHIVFVPKFGAKSHMEELSVILGRYFMNWQTSAKVGLRKGV